MQGKRLFLSKNLHFGFLFCIFAASKSLTQRRCDVVTSLIVYHMAVHFSLFLLFYPAKIRIIQKLLVTLRKN